LLATTSRRLTDYDGERGVHKYQSQKYTNCKG
jgi:hypothetical protein